MVTALPAGEIIADKYSPDIGRAGIPVVSEVNRAQALVIIRPFPPRGTAILGGFSGQRLITP